MAKSSEKIPELGDVVLVKQGIGIIRYIGAVDFDPDETYLGIEIKGPPVTGGTNGSQNGKSYFKCPAKRGIFVKNVIRKVTNEEILDKCAHLYDVVQGRTGFEKNKGNKHFIDRKTYNNLLEEYNLLKAKYASLDKSINEYDKMVVQYAILREKMGFMEGDYSRKIDENAKLNEKITAAERKLGTRLSQMDMSSIMHHLNNDKKDEFKIPDYGKIFGTSDNDYGQNGHHRRKSTLTTALENEENDFSKIAADVATDVYASNPNAANIIRQDNGKKKRGSVDINNDEIVDQVISSNQKTPTHFRKFSNTTKIVMKKNEEKKKAEAKGVPLEKGSFRSVRARSSMDMSNAQELQEINKPSRQSRDSVDINNAELAEINQGSSHRSRDSTTIDDFAPEYENEDSDNENDNYNNNKTHPKARDSVDLESSEINKINKPSRQSRESKTLDNENIMNNLKSEMDDDNIEIEDDPFGSNLAQKMKDQVANKKSKHVSTMSTNIEDIEKPAMDINNDDDDDADDEF